MTEISQEMLQMGARARAAASVLASAAPPGQDTGAEWPAADALDATRADVLAAECAGYGPQGKKKGAVAPPCWTGCCWTVRG